ncbi:MAG: peptidase M50 [Brevundimonas sp.]|uniref:Peptidase M50 n=1 Tax=Brevundimonas albigilva TaxID=1312364 RepID=A0ABY4SU13_9CAUL|nr:MULTISPECIES: site-2 protease family protein [Brevundimonas]PZU61483.1 MAG: peptidase M50 [Brevundimonas sp.]UQV18820.1 peptidase M50 [Brevundimonas albigilva]URI16383.1 peptidase M50 [Brevundimonas albigilva]
MSDTENTLRKPGRAPGPWDPKPEAAPVAGPARATAPAADQAPVEKDQSLVWAAASTLLMGGFLWWITGSVIVAGAILFGLFVHEAGHALVMNGVGMGPARIYIIPFLGGLAKGRREPRSEWDGVLVSLAGPAFGLLAMIPFVAVGLATGQGEWMAGAFFIAMLNLVNLVPAPPLDGSKALGPVLTRVHPRLEQVVLLVIGAAVVWWGVSTGRFILAVFLGLAVVAHLKRGVWRPAWGTLSWLEAGKSLGLYLLTAALCGAAAVGALLPVAEGSPADAVRLGLAYLGFGR